MPYFNLDSYAIITASDFSVTVIFLVSFLTIFTLIKDKFKSSTWIQIQEMNYLKLPIGFLIMSLGLVLRNGSRLMNPALKKEKDFDTLYWIDIYFIPIMYTISEMLIFIGLTFIFWPTLTKVSIRMFGHERPYNFYIFANIAMCVVIKALLTISSITAFYHLP